MKYVMTWFFVDLTSVIPFDLLFQNAGVNKIARFSRKGKLYKLIRMTKIARFIKIIRIKNKLVKHLAEMLKIGTGTERLVYLLLTFIVLLHLSACIW